MGTRTELFRMMPWNGGMNTSVNEAVIDSNELVRADNVIFDNRAARRVREGIYYNWDDATADTEEIIGQHFFSYGTTSRTSRLVAVSTKKEVYSHTSGGTRSNLTLTAAYPADITKVSMITYNNKVIIAVDGASNPVKQWTGSGNVDSVSNAPSASILREHGGRIWCNDKTNLDRLHFCEIGDETKWNGSGDSGYLYIGEGDGDPEGITAIFPTHRGDLFVAKKTKLYRISNTSDPLYAQVSLVSDGIGCVSHNSAISIDGNDVLFVSERGIHSLSATDAYGDFSSKFLSQKIQKTFIENFDRTKLMSCFGGYIPELQSAFFTFSDSDFSGSYMNCLYIYNIELGLWSRWIDIPCESLCVARDSDRIRLYFGGINNKIAKTQNSDFNDIDVDGNDEAVTMSVETGIIFPKGEFLIKGFKRLSINYKPEESHSLVANFKIDNHAVQNFSFSTSITETPLGTMVLGTDELGGSLVLAPYTLPVDGYGRGFKLTLTHNAIDQFVEIQGFSVEFEVSGTSQEVVAN